MRNHASARRTRFAPCLRDNLITPGAEEGIVGDEQAGSISRSALTGKTRIRRPMACLRQPGERASHSIRSIQLFA
jgi:hypothetical protein